MNQGITVSVHKTNMSDTHRRAHAGGGSEAVLPAQAVFAALAGLIAVAAVWLTATGYETLADGLHEDGPVEKASAVLWGGCALIALYFLPLHQLRSTWQIPAGFALLGARELDFDKRFLSEGILQARLYTGDAPLWEKAIGLAVVAVILLTAIRLLRHGGPQVLAALKAGAAWAWSAVGALALLVVSKSIDGIDRKLDDFGIELSAGVVERAMVAEELMELTGATLVVWAVCLGAGRLRALGHN